MAITRAKEKLSISYANKSPENKALQRSAFVDEILEETDIMIDEREVDAEIVLDAQYLALTESKAPVVPEADKAMITSVLENFTLSISSLNRFLKCPLSFYYEVVLRVPTVQSEAASYGTAIHFALMRIFERMRASEDKTFPDATSLITHFEEEMKRQRSYFTKKEYERRLEIGRTNLTAFYNQQVASWPKNVLLEHEVRNVELDGVPLNGTIDRIDILEDNKVHIADYKTGRIDSRRLQKPTEKNPLGGTYWRQLYFYKILYETSQQNKFARSGAISYLELDKKNLYPIKNMEFEAKELQLVKDMIKDSWKKIQAHEFYEGCGEKDCSWCNFLKDNVVVDSLRDLEVEALDD